MVKGYWIVRSDVSDTEKFSQYASLTPPILEKFGGTFIVGGGSSEFVEGSSRSRNAVIQFPSYKHALECWRSIEYQNARTYREGAAEMDVVIIEGRN